MPAEAGSCNCGWSAGRGGYFKDLVGCRHGNHQGLCKPPSPEYLWIRSGSQSGAFLGVLAALGKTATVQGVDANDLLGRGRRAHTDSLRYITTGDGAATVWQAQWSASDGRVVRVAPGPGVLPSPGERTCAHARSD